MLDKETTAKVVKRCCDERIKDPCTGCPLEDLENCGEALSEAVEHWLAADE